MVGARKGAGLDPYPYPYPYPFVHFVRAKKNPPPESEGLERERGCAVFRRLFCPCPFC